MDKWVCGEKVSTEEIVQQLQTTEPISEPTAEERLEALEAAMLDVLEVLANG